MSESHWSLGDDPLTGFRRGDIPSLLDGLGCIQFTNKLKAETQQLGIELVNFKPRLESGIFKCIS
jgi:hypothetical protein